MGSSNHLLTSSDSADNLLTFTHSLDDADPALQTTPGINSEMETDNCKKSIVLQKANPCFPKVISEDQILFIYSSHQSIQDNKNKVDTFFIAGDANLMRKPLLFNSYLRFLVDNKPFTRNTATITNVSVY